jgi:hypothetical protein
MNNSEHPHDFDRDIFRSGGGAGAKRAREFISNENPV